MAQKSDSRYDTIGEQMKFIIQTGFDVMNEPEISFHEKAIHVPISMLPGELPKFEIGSITNPVLYDGGNRAYSKIICRVTDGMLNPDGYNIGYINVPSKYVLITVEEYALLKAGIKPGENK